MESVGADTSLQSLLERCMIAIDNEYVMQPSEKVQITPQSEVAIIPPVSGGWVRAFKFKLVWELEPTLFNDW